MPKRASPHRVAVVQHPPVTLHRDQTLERGVELIEKAAAGGARLVSFPETWVPGYPEWLWRLRPGDDYKLTGDIHRQDRAVRPHQDDRVVQTSRSAPSSFPTSSPGTTPATR